ncbi:MAG TPA: ABC transporter ATP-binding protein [Thermoflexales bacterium]|nr:ABC transporter ATP-binding protein [Thermoflexales bacterium]HQX76615.1 ABC transporter ATP-binding protein [Thermoflexales bacterium]HQZ22351.1 ABC transporter ATP-binding protein [Thermoflexales bacterium]
MPNLTNSAVPVIDAQDITKVYRMGEIEVYALHGASLQIFPGELASIMGPSGSGKSTLMNILGCLDQPSSGLYKLDGVDVSQLNENQLAEVRNKKIGFVFQSFNLLRRTTALENVEQPMIYAGVNARDRRERARAALAAVGLGDRTGHHANELSGGQQQRVAIARALVTEPSMILADEPTGNLDSKSGAEIMCLFQQLNQDKGITVIFVTHDPRIAQHTRRVIRISDGKITGDDAVTDQLMACK